MRLHYSINSATVPTGSVHGLGLRGRERAGRSPTAGQEGMFFLLNSYLIRLIHLIFSSYIERIS
jgi:hypothetical protein